MRTVLLILMIAFTAGCAEPETGEEAEATASTEEARAAAASADGASGMIHNTPEGGVLEWVRDIRTGLDSVAALAGSDPAAAQGAVLNLYVMRQEYLEGYYGPGGRLEATPELAEAIETNEARFHALMSELSTEAPDSAGVAALTDSLAAQTARVRAAAEAVGRELTPWPAEGP